MFLPLVKPILRLALKILSIILYLLTIFAAFGGRFDTEIFTFPAILTLGLPILAFMTLIVTAVWFICRRIFMGALGVLAILCCWGPISTVSPLSSPDDARRGEQTFTVMSWNIKHAQDQEVKDDSTGNRSIDYLVHCGADIVCLQELDAFSAKEIKNWSPEMRAQLMEVYPFWTGNKFTDQMVLSKYPIIYQEGYNYIKEPYHPKRYSFYKVSIGDRVLTLIDLHLTSFALDKEQQNFVTEMTSIGGVRKSMLELKDGIYAKLKHGFKTRREDAAILRRALQEIPGPLVICGDLNDVPESYAYRLLRGNDLKDAYVETGFGPMVTFNQHMFWFHLDQIFYRGPLRALRVWRGNIKSSDHYPVYCEFAFEK